MDRQSDDSVQQDDRGTESSLGRALAMAAAAGAGGAILAFAAVYTLGRVVFADVSFMPMSGSGPSEISPLKTVTILGSFVLLVAGGALVARVTASDWVQAAVASVGGFAGGFCITLLFESSVASLAYSATDEGSLVQSSAYWVAHEVSFPAVMPIFVVAQIVVIASFLGRVFGGASETRATAVAAAVLCLAAPLLALNVAIAIPAGVVAWVLMPVVAVLASSNADRRGL